MQNVQAITTTSIRQFSTLPQLVDQYCAEGNYNSLVTMLNDHIFYGYPVPVPAEMYHKIENRLRDHEVIYNPKSKRYVVVSPEHELVTA